MNTNNVVGRIAKAIQFKHGVISNDIATKQAAYEAESDAFRDAEESAETAFLQAYNLADSNFQTQEEQALEDAEQEIVDRFDLIQSNATVAVDTLAEFDAQIDAEKIAFENDKLAKESVLEAARIAITSEFGGTGDFSIPVIGGYTVVELA